VGDTNFRPTLELASGSAFDCTRLENLLASAHSAEPVLTMDETLALFAARLAQNITFDDLALYERQNDILLPTFVTGKHRSSIEPLRIPVGQGVTGWVAQANRTILNGNPSVEPGWTESSTLLSALAVPVESPEGLVGVLTLYSGIENGFRSEDLKLLSRLSSALSPFVKRNTHPAPANSTGFPASSAPFSDPRATAHLTAA
jgi:putative methionine-R-sulfoxide reductase with GAF domain